MVWVHITTFQTKHSFHLRDSCQLAQHRWPKVKNEPEFSRSVELRTLVAGAPYQKRAMAAPRACLQAVTVMSRQGITCQGSQTQAMGCRTDGFWVFCRQRPAPLPFRFLEWINRQLQDQIIPIFPIDDRELLLTATQPTHFKVILSPWSYQPQNSSHSKNKRVC